MPAEMGYPGYSNFCLANYKFGGFHNMPSGSAISWNDSQNSAKHFVNYYWLIIKSTTQGTAKWKRYMGQSVGIGWGVGNFRALPRYATLPAPPHAHQPGSPLKPSV